MGEQMTLAEMVKPSKTAAFKVEWLMSRRIRVPTGMTRTTHGKNMAGIFRAAHCRVNRPNRFALSIDLEKRGFHERHFPGYGHGRQW
jgi:hypothetical protein